VPERRGPLWTRPTTAKPERLTRDRVVAVAVALADREGLDAVSVRRIASELQARPMSLYTFFERKDDLIDLMVDHVLGEMLVEEVPPDWRTAIRAILRRQIEVGRQHIWLMAAIGQRVLLGPNAARHAEQSHAAIAGLGLDNARAVGLLRVVDVYLWGFVTIATAELTARRRDDLSEEEWHQSTDDYFENLTADGDFPHLAEAGRAALLPGPADDWLKAFDEGLGWILDGFAATLPDGHPLS
jgi:AcrR family transcriptional regulator